MPKPWRKPAHYSTIYEVPTTRVRPGLFGSQNISSDVMEYYFAPGIYGYVGRPPVAISILSAVTVSVLPSPAVNYRVLADTNLASLLKYTTF